MNNLTMKRNEVPNNLGTQLVDILYANTRLNYDVCALNLIQIFEHLSLKLPKLEELSHSVINSIQNGIGNKEFNPDLIQFEHNLKFLSDLNAELQSGEKNFYECNNLIEKYLKQCNQLLLRQTSFGVFKTILSENRRSVVSIFEIWQLSTNKTIKNCIIEFFNLSFQTFPVLIRLLFENTNIASELCCQIKQEISLMNSSNGLSLSCKCLIIMLMNSDRMPFGFNEFLKSNDVLEILFETIESEKSFIFSKLNSENDELKSTMIENLDFALIDLLVHLILALNKKFMLPEENLVINLINSNSELTSNRKYLSEIVINLFNSEKDPLIDYKIECSELNETTMENENFYYVNSILKFISDLFSSTKTLNSTSIFYSNDFNVLIDITIRKLANLTAEDQIRVDYLALIQLIIKNSNYMQSLYRNRELVDTFNSILNEKDQHTIDQDIVKIILSENPKLKNF